MAKVGTLLFLTLCWNANAETLWLNDIAVKNEGGHWVSEWATVNVPSGLSNFQIVAQGSQNSIVQISDVISPNGESYVASDLHIEKLNSHSQPIWRNVLSPNRSLGVMPGTGTLIVPNNPELPLPQAGRWQVRAYFQSEPKDKKVSFWFRWGRPRSSVSRTQVPLNVQVAPNTYWSKNPQRLVEVLKKAQEMYSEINMDLQFKPPQDSNAINTYFLPAREYQSKPVNGVSCIGGPVGMDVPHSCAVSVFAREDAGTLSVDQQAKILVHELGHYLGLFHTTDTFMGIGRVFDPFSDTKEEVSGANMMDPGIHQISPHFSKMQAEFIQGSPVLSE